MDDQQNQGMPGGGSVPPPPAPGGGVPPPPPVGGLGGEDPHAQVMAVLSRIEAKLAEISTKLGV